MDIGVIKKELSLIIPVITKHNLGKKRVLISEDETLSGITQIAFTQLSSNDIIEEHIHPTMEEFFFFLKGEVIVTVNGKSTKCKANDFVFIPANTNHILEVIQDVEMITIGCALEEINNEKLN